MSVAYLSISNIFFKPDIALSGRMDYTLCIILHDANDLASHVNQDEINEANNKWLLQFLL